MSKDKYIGYFKTKSGDTVYRVFGKSTSRRWRYSIRKFNALHKTITGYEEISCDFIRLHCNPITKKEYANW